MARESELYQSVSRQDVDLTKLAGIIKQQLQVSIYRAIDEERNWNRGIVVLNSIYYEDAASAFPSVKFFLRFSE